MTPRLKPGAFHLARANELTGLRRIYSEAPKSGEIPGCVDLSTEQIAGQPILRISVKQDQIARYGVAAEAVLQLV